MSAWRLSRSFLGSRASITEARRFVTYFLQRLPVVDTAELIVSELATNAIHHSASGRFGGRFAVNLHVQPDRLWIGVLDQGGDQIPQLCNYPPEALGGRGLLLVATLATTWGVTGDDRGRTVWVILPLPRPATP
jgi:serine/threonine-protein kinase RsbW